MASMARTALRRPVSTTDRVFLDDQGLDMRAVLDLGALVSIGTEN
jgi:hypothetical protein